MKTIKGIIIEKSNITSSYKRRGINQVAHDYIIVKTDFGEIETFF
jgi:hypothetical protein